MRVGCWDCNTPLEGKSFDRPRTAKCGMKNTVSVCKRCLVLWYLKQFKREQVLFDKGELVEMTLKWKGVNMAIKFLEALK